MSTPVLSLQNVRVQFDGVIALDLPSLDLFSQAPMAILLGPNGAGKSSLLNAATGYAALSREARITLHNGDSTDLTKLSRSRIVRTGVARTFQKPVVFGSLTVHESILVAAQSASNGGPLARVLALLQPPQAHTSAALLAEVLLREFDLWEVRRKFVQELPFVVLRRAEFARTLATQPSVLFLDEPTAGSDPSEARFLTALLTGGLSEKVRRLHAEGIYRHGSLALGLITHDADLLEALAAGCDPEPLVHDFDRGCLVRTMALPAWLAARKLEMVAAHAP